MPFSKILWPMVNIAGLLLLAFTISAPFNLELLFHDTILTGGDAGSWYQIATHLKESLIPNGRLFGWDQGNFFGYPNLQHYFVLPFLLTVLLSYAIPLTVALKLVTIIGFFALPFLVFWALRKLHYQNPIPLAGAWLSLIFLFHERYSMFGGNLLSNLAGEFCYSFAFALLVIFIAKFITDIREQRLSPGSGILLGLIGLSHAFVFFIAILMPIYFLLRKPTHQTIKISLLTYFFGFLVMAFWVLPMLSQLSFTTPIIINWRFPLPMEFLSSLFYEILIIAGIFGLFSILKVFRTTEGMFFLFMMLGSFILYLIASSLKIPDIRFFPPLLFFTLLFIVDGSAGLIKFHQRYRQLASACLLGLCILAGGSFVNSEDKFASKWFDSNYSGFESHKAFLDGSASHLFNTLKGTYNDPRVAWEQGGHDAYFGTMRAFENIPLFTGRASTEGIHYASALLSLPITILNSEYSKTPGSPSPNIYSHYFVDDIPDRFRLLNIRDFIAFTPEITRLFEESGEFDIVDKQPPYTIFTLKSFDSHYIESPKYQPFITENFSNWKHRFNNWFRRGDNLDLTLVNGKFVSQQSTNKLFTHSTANLLPTGIIENAQRVAIEPAKISNIEISNFSISFDTDKPGTPHIVKFAYSPAWHSINSENIFMVAPGFMLIYPETDHVEIVYGRNWAEYLGIVLSLLGLALILYYLACRQQFMALLSHPFVEKLILTFEYARKTLFWILGIITVVMCISSYISKQHIYNDYITGNKLIEAGKPEEAIERYKNNVSMEIINHVDDGDVPTSIYALARTYRNLGRIELAKTEFHKLIDFYPRWIFIDEIYWHLGAIALEQNHLDQAVSLFEKCLAIAKFGDFKTKCEEDLNKASTLSDRKTKND